MVDQVRSCSPEDSLVSSPKEFLTHIYGNGIESHIPGQQNKANESITLYSSFRSSATLIAKKTSTFKFLFYTSEGMILLEPFKKHIYNYLLNMEQLNANIVNFNNKHWNQQKLSDSFLFLFGFRMRFWQVHLDVGTFDILGITSV